MRPRRRLQAPAVRNPDLGKLVDSNSRLSMEATDLKLRLAAERARYEDLLSQYDATAREVVQLKTKTAALATLRQSLSWKLTRPVRWLEGRVGKKANRKVTPSAVPAGTHTRPELQPDILFLIGCWDGESKRYRVYNIIEGLRDLGYSVRVMDVAHGHDIVAQDLRPAVAIFFRAPLNPRHGTIEVLEHFRNAGVRTVFDVDDYVFEPAIVGDIAAVARMPAEQRASYQNDVRAYRAMMFLCDRATASTAYLVDRMRELGRDAWHVTNSINAAQMARADELIANPKADGAFVRICYFSGSQTHWRDFQACADGLRAVMTANSRVILRIVGHLDLDESWDAVSGQIERQSFMPYLDTLNSMRECDINLACLEEGNAFAEGKSELKFFESALVEIPTVASRTAPYAAAIDDGQNGALASTPEDWEARLTELTASAELRHTMGRNARRTALERFGFVTAAHQALVSYGFSPPPREEPAPPTGKSIAWIVPGLIIGGGGHRNILRAAYHLEQFGHDVRLYFSDTGLDAATLRSQVHRHFYPFQGPVRRFTPDIEKVDVLIATHWSTVELAESVGDRAGSLIYFVQDFEPAFYPMGSEYLMAENTYRKGLYAITSGPWCEQILRRDYAMEADHFLFPVDRDVYRNQPAVSRRRRILFFAKPDMPRRCFQIGIAALKRLHALKPDVEIAMFGSGAAANMSYDFPVTHLGVLPSLADLAKAYAECSLGLVFSTTNPSLVPYEMMACGLPIVDLDRPGASVSYGDRSDIAFLADQDPVRMGEQIADWIDDETELSNRRERGLSLVAALPTEAGMARRVEALILAKIEDGNPVASHRSTISALLSPA